MTVRDFTQIFEAYAEFEEAVIGARLEQARGEEDDVELDLRMARFEQLLDRRPFLVNDVLLRQNPHNVLEWMKRVQLLAESSSLPLNNAAAEKVNDYAYNYYIIIIIIIQIQIIIIQIMSLTRTRRLQVFIRQP